MNDIAVKKRQSNIELLRIISMLFIVFFHCKGYFYENSGCVFDNLGYVVLGSWGIVGVDIFVCIYSWFYTEDHTGGVLKKAISIISVAISYSIFFIVVTFIVNLYKYGIKSSFYNIIKIELQGMVQPLWAYRYWYVTTYVFLMILAPYIEKVVDCSDSESYKKLYLVCTLIAFASTFDNVKGNGYVATDVFEYCYIFITIRGIKKYRYNILTDIRLLCIAIGLMGCIILNNLFELPLYSLFGNTDRHSFIILIIAVSLFLWWIENVDIGEISCVNWIASKMYGVYLFHASQIINMVRVYMYIFNRRKWNRNFIEFLTLGIVVFMMGMVVEICRSLVRIIITRGKQV
jgi:surface polysaccharide O-acyltransferase-like enzyme